jgi:hypothetical protein
MCSEADAMKSSNVDKETTNVEGTRNQIPGNMQLQKNDFVTDTFDLPVSRYCMLIPEAK